MTAIDEARPRAKDPKAGVAMPKRAKGKPRKPQRPPGRARGSLIAALDIGTTKVCCFIARVEPDKPRVVGIGHQVSRGLRNGAIVDLEAAGKSVVSAVHAAEQMAGETIHEVVTNLSGGFSGSRIIKAEIGVAGREIGDNELQRVLDQGYLLREPGDRQIVHSVPVGFSIDDSRGIRDPRGMFGERLGVNMNVVTANAASVRNHTAAIGRSHLEVDALVVSPYAAGLSCLVEDEIGLGVTVIDMGGGTTTIGVFFDGNLVFADSVPVGGCARHQRHRARAVDPGRPCRAHEDAVRHRDLRHRRRARDDRRAADRRGGGGSRQPRAEIACSSASSRRASRRPSSWCATGSRRAASTRSPGRRVVLTGGACQLHGAREFAGLILDKQVRIGRPLRVAGLAEATGGPAFSTAVGLLHFAVSERAETPRAGRGPAGPPSGMFGRLGHWLKENI